MGKKMGICCEGNKGLGVRGSFDLGHYAIYFLTVIFMIAGVVGFALVYVGVDFYDVYKVKSKIEDVYLVNEIVNKCFVYVDSNGREYPGFLDLERFNNGTLERCVGKNVRVEMQGKGLEDRAIGIDKGLGYTPRLVHKQHVRIGLFDGGEIKIISYS